MQLVHIMLDTSIIFNLFDASTVIDSYVPLKAHGLVKMILNHNKRDRETERERVCVNLLNIPLYMHMYLFTNLQNERSVGFIILL